MIQAGPLTNNISAILASFEKYLFDIKQDWHIKILHTDILVPTQLGSLLDQPGIDMWLWSATVELLARLVN